MVSLSRRLVVNARIWAIVATVSWGGMAGLWGCEKFYDPRNDYADGGAGGPYAVRAVTITNEDQVVYEITSTLDPEHVEPGQTIGWTSSLCVEKGVYLLARADLIRLRDGTRVTPGRERLFTPRDHRCGTTVGALELPLDAEEGEYEIRRRVWSNPLGWFPQRATNNAVRFRVARATKAPR